MAADGTGTVDWRPRVLIADDEVAIRSLMARALAALGVEVVAVGDGAAAVAACCDGASFACALLDVRMPVMDGLEAARRIQEMLPYLPIVVTSGDTTAASVAALLRTGRVSFLNKPFGLHELRAVVAEALAQQSASLPTPLPCALP